MKKSKNILHHRQLEHEEVILGNQKNNSEQKIVLLLDGLRTPSNIAGIFRLAECFDVSKIYISSDEELLMSKAFRSISRVHEKKLNIEKIHVNDAVSVLKNYQEQLFKVIAVEYTEESVAISEFKINENVLLILGNERHGISEKCLKLCDHSVHIPMYGTISSLNVQQACAIGLFAFRSQRV